MQKLLNGYRHFRAEVFPKWKDHFHLLAESQAPEVLFITCSDSRVVPSLIFQTEPGDMFLCRNAGNVVPPTGNAAGGVSATIEYAVKVLKVRHILLCGHSDCGAVRAAIDPEKSRNLPLVRPWLYLVKEAQRAARDLLAQDMPSKTATDANLLYLIQANIVGQLANLRTQPSVAEALAAGTIQVHGWYYDIMTGSVEVYLPAERRFVPLEDSLSSSNF